MVNLEFNHLVLACQYIDIQGVLSLNYLYNLLTRIATSLQTERTLDIFLASSYPNNSQAFLIVNNSIVNCLTTLKDLDVYILILGLSLVEIDLIQINHLTVLILYIVSLKEIDQFQLLFPFLNGLQVVGQICLKFFQEHKTNFGCINILTLGEVAQ